MVSQHQCLGAKGTIKYSIQAQAGDLPISACEMSDALSSEPTRTRGLSIDASVRFLAGYCVHRFTRIPLRSSSLIASKHTLKQRRYLGIAEVLMMTSILLVAACTRATEPFTGTEDEQPAGSERTALASVVIEPERLGPPVDHIQASPQDVTLTPGQRFLFAAVARDSKGKPVKGSRLVWKVNDPSAGTITSPGLFTAGSTTGLYPGVVEVSTFSATRIATATVGVAVVSQAEAEARRLNSVALYPPDITVRPGQVVGLGALGWDDRGQLVQNLEFLWSMDQPAAGSVDQLGAFTASQAPGRYPNAIRVVATQDTHQRRVEHQAFISVTVRDGTRRGVLSRVLVVPGSVILTPTQRVDFIAKAFDEGGQPVRGVSFTWEVTEPEVGSMEVPGQFVAGHQTEHYGNAIRVVATKQTPEGPVEAKTTVSVTVEPLRVAAELVAARLVPVMVNLSPGQRFVFSVSGLDADANPVAANSSWEMVDPMAGSIDQSGVLTAGHQPGVYKNAMRIVLSQEQGDRITIIEGYATVNVLGPMDRVEIRPSTATIETGQSIRLRAVGYDANGLEIPSLRLGWSVGDSRAGSVDEAGLFTAGANPGRYENAIKVTAVEVDTR